MTSLTYHKISMSHDIIGNVSLYQEMVDSVSSDGSVEGVVYGTATHVRTIHAATQMEVDGVAAQAEGLPTLTHLHMFYPV